MRKILMIMVLMFTAFSYAQTSNDSISVDKGFYAAAGLSIGNSNGSNFQSTSYPSVEVGFYRDNLSFGLVAGRSDLAAFGQEFKGDNISKYWYEGKTAVSVPMSDSVSGYALFGVGNYVNTSRIFIEYGFGVSTKVNRLTYFVQYSNWDGYNYVTPGISFNL